MYKNNRFKRLSSVTLGVLCMMGVSTSTQTEILKATESSHTNQTAKAIGEKQQQQEGLFVQLKQAAIKAKNTALIFKKELIGAACAVVTVYGLYVFTTQQSSLPEDDEEKKYKEGDEDERKARVAEEADEDAEEADEEIKIRGQRRGGRRMTF